MATYQNITDNAPDGAQVGLTSSSPVGLYGATPVAQQSDGVAITVAGIGFKVCTGPDATVAWGFDSSAHATNFLTELAAIRTALVNIGMIA